jgi:hypothetical protein
MPLKTNKGALIDVYGIFFEMISKSVFQRLILIINIEFTWTESDRPACLGFCSVPLPKGIVGILSLHKNVFCNLFCYTKFIPFIARTLTHHTKLTFLIGYVEGD